MSDEETIYTVHSPTKVTLGREAQEWARLTWPTLTREEANRKMAENLCAQHKQRIQQGGN